jgi:lipopolysaccharide biosynthesis glycosyltransferase
MHLQRETIFDYRYVSKFVINNFSNIDQYDNFLFLDLDIICNANLDKVFETINNSDIVHGVKEKECLLKSDHFHKFDDLSSYNINDSDLAYNAGTFGFNKNLRKIFINFIDFINQNKNQYCDQPIFNVYFNHHKLIQPTLSEFVFLENYSININPIEKCNLVHFLGNYGNIHNKITRIKNYVKN